MNENMKRSNKTQLLHNSHGKKIVALISTMVISLVLLSCSTSSKDEPSTTSIPGTTESMAGFQPTVTPAPTASPFPEEFTDDYGVAMRLVPAGEFMMGGDKRGDEIPIHTLFLDAYYIDKYEVTNRLYKTCVDAGICQPPVYVSSYTRLKPFNYYENSEFDDFPVIFVDWNMAKTFCEWRGARLPTEAEWEKAARGTDARTYPWGEGIDCTKGNFKYGNEDCNEDTTAVGSYEEGKSPYGVYDMGGNVWEWVSSLYKPYPYDATDGRENLNSSEKRVIRGGSWYFSDSFAQTSLRYPKEATILEYDVGFRCAR